MRSIRLPGVLVWLTGLWVLLWGDLSTANVLAGLVVAIGVLTLTRLPRPSDPDDAVRVAPLAAVHFLGYVIVKLVEANLVLAKEIVTPRNRINTGVVEASLRTESNLATMIVANVITLTPGTVVLESKGSPPVLYVNVLHLHDLDQVRRDLLRIEQLSVRAFGSRAARRELAGNAS